METGLSDNVNLDGWVSTRVVDLTSVDLGDRHNDAFCEERGISSKGRRVGLMDWYERVELTFMKLMGR